MDDSPLPPRYQLLREGVWDLLDGVAILPQRDPTRWQAYLEWLAVEGNRPLPLAPPPPPSQEELDARAEETTRRGIINELRVDAAISALRNRTPAQVDAWIDANVTTLAEARTVLKILARILAILARERLG
jgi:hypothetical protein